MVAGSRLIFNRTTTRDDVPEQWRGRQELHSGPAHLAQQRHSSFIYEVHFPEVNDGLPSHCGRCSRLPTLTQLLHPKPRHFAFQPKSKFTGGVMERDFEHTRLVLPARSMPWWN